MIAKSPAGAAPFAEAGPDAVRPAFDPVRVARDLLRRIRVGTLATIARDGGGPFATLVTVATAFDGSPLLLLSGLSAHTKNLDGDPRASLLLAATGKGDPLAHPRLTLTGRIEPCDDPAATRRFIARHPKAALYAGFGDFGFRRLGVDGVHLNGGFARAATLGPADLIADAVAASALAAAEPDILSELNAGSRLSAIVRAAGLPSGRWKATGCDPEGLDLLRGDEARRVAFRARVLDRAGWDAALAEFTARGPSA